MSNWVRWSQWNENGMIGVGQMPIKDVQTNLQTFELEAKQLLKSTNADHVVYGVKEYNNDGELDNVKFYMLPMSDKDFDERVATLKGRTIYALHRRA